MSRALERRRNVVADRLEQLLGDVGDARTHHHLMAEIRIRTLVAERADPMRSDRARIDPEPRLGRDRAEAHLFQMWKRERARGLDHVSQSVGTSIAWTHLRDIRHFAHAQAVDDQQDDTPDLPCAGVHDFLGWMIRALQCCCDHSVELNPGLRR